MVTDTLPELSQDTIDSIYNDLRLLSRHLERLNGVFCQFWELGRPIITRNVETASVGFDPSGACISFSINPDFWQLLNMDTKLFLICHECMHVILNHGSRSVSWTKDSTDFERALQNIAMDVVINETIATHFGIDRSRLNFGEVYDIQHPESIVLPDDHPFKPMELMKHGAFLDTVFATIKPDIEPRRSYEYYYGVLVDYFAKEIKEQKDQQEYMNQIMDMLKKVMADSHESHESMKNSTSDAIVKDIIETSTKEDVEEVSEAMDEEFGKGHPGDPLLAGAIKELVKIDYRKVKKLQSWQSLFRKCVRKQQEEAEDYQWAMPNRRNAMLPKDYLMPALAETDTEDTRFKVWLFIDSSGSCHHLKDQFFYAAYSLDPKYFNVKIFSRTTEVQELDYANPQITGYGSDDYRCIEDYIQKQLKTRKISSYPEIVMHFTDGGDCSGEMVKPQKPLNWYWFMTDEMDTEWVPKECIDGGRVFKLTDFRANNES